MIHRCAFHRQSTSARWSEQPLEYLWLLGTRRRNFRESSKNQHRTAVSVLSRRDCEVCTQSGSLDVFQSELAICNGGRLLGARRVFLYRVG